MGTRVQPSEKIAIVAHCILNQNAKPYLRARYHAIVTPVLDVLVEEGFALFQLPCPEIGFGGVHRFSQVIEQYDTPRYRAHCRDLARVVVDQLEPYFRERYKVVIITVDGSPSCGFRFVGSNPDWKGYPGSNVIDVEYPTREGVGIFVQELKRECEIRNVPFPKGFGIGLDLPDINLNNLHMNVKIGLQKCLSQEV